MPFGPGEHEVRKLQSTGGSTFTVSLPKPWILEQELKARDSTRGGVLDVLGPVGVPEGVEALVEVAVGGADADEE